MRFEETPLRGSFEVHIEPHSDQRGLFARTFCSVEFERQGLPTRFVQCSTSFSLHEGTIRGMHFQRDPSAEAKLVRCTAGAIWSVVVDLRPKSPTYLHHHGVELSADNRKAIFIPPGFADGFQTLAPNAEVFYQMTEYFAPDLAGGLRSDDSRLGISWPLPVSKISAKDKSWPLLPSAEA